MPPLTPYLRQSFEATRSHLLLSVSWTPTVAFLSIGLLLLCLGHVLVGFNPRVGNLSEVLTLPSPRAEDGGHWMSVSARGSELIIKSSAEVFTFPLVNFSREDLSPLEAQLQHHLVEQLLSTAISGKTLRRALTVTISVDQQVKYRHILPILQLFADLGITRYGFETRQPLVDDPRATGGDGG